MTTWNPADKAVGITLTNGNLTATSNGTNSLVRSTTNNSSGKLYLEFTATTVNGTAFRVGFANSTQGLTSALGGNTNGVGYASNNGAVITNGATIGTAATYTTGNLIGVAVDFTNKLVWFAVNGGNWNNSGTASPATGAGGFSLSTLAAGPYFIAFYGNFGGNACTMEPGGGSFTPPSGFSPWDGGTTYNDSVTESGSASDRPSSIATLPSSVSETGAASEASGVALIAAADVGESGSASDNRSDIATLPSSVTEALVASDGVAGTASHASVVAEAGLASDLPSGLATLPSAVVETGAAQDALSALVSLAGLVSEFGLAVDHCSAAGTAPFEPDFALLAPTRAEAFLAPACMESLLAPTMAEAFLAE